MTHNPANPSLEVRINQSITSDGSAIIPPKVARWLDRKAGMTADRRINLRTTDPEAYVALTALHISACHSATGTESTAGQPNTTQSEMLMTTAAAAQSLNVTDRCIRKWCAAGRLRAQRLGGRWLIYPSSITALKNIA